MIRRPTAVALVAAILCPVPGLLPVAAAPPPPAPPAAPNVIAAPAPRAAAPDVVPAPVTRATPAAAPSATPGNKAAAAPAAAATGSGAPAGAPAQPPQPENPFAAAVIVPDESDRSRDKGMRDALIEVLKRVSGKADVAFSEILSRANVLVQQYGFVKDAVTQDTIFRAAFDPSGVQDALREQGLPVFGVDADIIEAWVVDVQGVTASAEYARLLGYFGGIRGVRRVDVDEVREDGLRLRMTVEGGTERVAALVAGGGVVRETAPGMYELAR